MGAVQVTVVKALANSSALGENLAVGEDIRSMQFVIRFCNNIGLN